MELTPLLVDKDPAAKLDSAACGRKPLISYTYNFSDLKNRIPEVGFMNRHCKVIRKDKFCWTGKYRVVVSLSNVSSDLDMLFYVFFNSPTD